MRRPCDSRVPSHPAGYFIFVVLKQIFLAARDGRVPLYDLLLLGAGGALVSATAARIASHAYAMPPATQPAVTQASPILFGCRVHAGQVHSAEDLLDGGLRAGRVALERPESLYFSEVPLVEYLHGKKSTHILRCALLFSGAWHVLIEHARDRGRSVRDEPILEHAQDSQHG